MRHAYSSIMREGKETELGRCGGERSNAGSRQNGGLSAGYSANGPQNRLTAQRKEGRTVIVRTLSSQLVYYKGTKESTGR
ncbi:hypothetical protein BDW68DRAFT_144240 [Aspergillus falconensis]